MSEGILDDRRRALEEAFFAKQNEALRRQLSERDEARSRKEAISAATGVTDDAALDRLAGLDMGADTLAALSVVPLVAVAWADGSVGDKERAAVLSAAAEHGLDKRGASYALLNQWLAQRPPPDLLAHWNSYVAAISPTLGAESKRALRAELLGRARQIAEASGGFFGMGRRISAAEEAVLRQVEGALS